MEKEYQRDYISLEEFLGMTVKELNRHLKKGNEKAHYFRYKMGIPYRARKNAKIFWLYKLQFDDPRYFKDDKIKLYTIAGKIIINDKNIHPYHYTLFKSDVYGLLDNDMQESIKNEYLKTKGEVEPDLKYANILEELI